MEVQLGKEQNKKFKIYKKEQEKFERKKEKKYEVVWIENIEP